LLIFNGFEERRRREKVAIRLRAAQLRYDDGNW
jgi:hypothetical protein